MKQIPGAEITVFRNDTRIPVAEDGYLGRYREGKLMFSVLAGSLESGARLVNIIVNDEPGQAKTVIPNAGMKGEDGKEMYSKAVGIKFSEKYGVAVTHYNRNYLSFLELHPDGTFVLWEAAIVSQKGEFFLAVQDKYRERCFLVSEKVVCPEMAGWPELITVLENLYRESGPTQLAPLETFQSRQDLPARNTIPKNEARVLFWDSRKGFGALEAPDRSARFSVKDAAPRPGERFIYFQKGDLVKVQNFQRNKEALPEQFQWDAHGVQAL